MLLYFNWTVCPEILNYGSLHVRWYGLLWAIGFMLGYYLERNIYNREKLPEETIDKVFIIMLFSTLIGARLGHCLFYEWDYFTSHPVKILYIWQGGLSSHGGAFGILTGLFFFSRMIKKSYIWVLDRIIIAVAICGACIRLGNLMNHEIYGDPTTMPWAFSFMLKPLVDNSPMSEPSHPTQIYEMIYCLVTFAVTYFLYWKTEARKRPGLIFGVFLIGVFYSRFLLEFIKRPQEDFEMDMLINMGQILSLPFFIVGFALIAYNVWKWGGEKTENKMKSNVIIAALSAFVLIPSAVLVCNRQNSLNNIATGTSVVDVQPIGDMTREQCLDFLNGTRFESEYGVIAEFKNGSLYLDGQKASNLVTPNPQSGRYYIYAPMVKGGANHYVLQANKDCKSVLLNVDDSRGNYHQVK